MGKIIILGDSFTFGHGCSDRIYYFDSNSKKLIGNMDSFLEGPSQYSWPSLLQKTVKGEVINLAKPGNSNQGMFKDFKKYIEIDTFNKNGSFSNIDAIFFCGTFIDRLEIANPFDNNDTMSWVMSSIIPEYTFNSKHKLAKKQFVSFLYNNEVGVNYTLTALLSVYSLAKANNIKFFYSFPNWSWDELKKHNEIYNVLKEHEIPTLTDLDFLECQDKEKRDKMIAVDGHANDVGHLSYFKLIIEPLIKSINGE